MYAYTCETTIKVINISPLSKVILYHAGALNFVKAFSVSIKKSLAKGNEFYIPIIIQFLR